MKNKIKSVKKNDDDNGEEGKYEKGGKDEKGGKGEKGGEGGEDEEKDYDDDFDSSSILSPKRGTAISINDCETLKLCLIIKDFGPDKVQLDENLLVSQKDERENIYSFSIIEVKGDFYNILSITRVDGFINVMEELSFRNLVLSISNTCDYGLVFYKKEDNVMF